MHFPRVQTTLVAWLQIDLQLELLDCLQSAADLICSLASQEIWAWPWAYTVNVNISQS